MGHYHQRCTQLQKKQYEQDFFVRESVCQLVTACFSHANSRGLIPRSSNYGQLSLITVLCDTNWKGYVCADVHV